MFVRNTRSKRYIEKYNELDVDEKMTYEYTYPEFLMLYIDAYPAWKRLTNKEKSEFKDFKQFQWHLRMYGIIELATVALFFMIFFGVKYMLGL